MVALPKPWFGNQREDFNTFRFHFVGECMALVVTETPRKPMVEQVDAFTEIMVSRHHKAALLSLRHGNKPDRMAGPIVDAADRTRPRIDRVKGRTTDTST